MTKIVAYKSNGMKARSLRVNCSCGYLGPEPCKALQTFEKDEILSMSAEVKTNLDRSFWQLNIRYKEKTKGIFGFFFAKALDSKLALIQAYISCESCKYRRVRVGKRK